MRKKTYNEKVKQASDNKKVVPLLPKNPAQKNYIECINRFPQIFVTGPAGTGKTYIAAAMAADMFLRKDVSKIVLTRPNIPAGKSLGFFAGTIEEKIAPWVIPLTEVLEQRLRKGRFEIAMKRQLMATCYSTILKYILV